jgi:secreted protein with Ig-like and vWFA domain
VKFRTKTVLGVALIEGILLAVLGISLLGKMKDTNEDEITRRVSVTASLLAASTRDAMISYRPGDDRQHRNRSARDPRSDLCSLS